MVPGYNASYNIVETLEIPLPRLLTPPERLVFLIRFQPLQRSNNDVELGAIQGSTHVLQAPNVLPLLLVFRCLRSYRCWEGENLKNQEREARVHLGTAVFYEVFLCSLFVVTDNRQGQPGWVAV